MSVASIKAHADAIKAEADALPAPGSPSLPAGVNCLCGTVPSIPSFTPWDGWSDAKVRHSRMQGDVEPGRIAFLGSSVTASMNVARVHHAGVNWGIGGDTMRGLLNRMASLTHLTTAGGVVLEVGINDAGYTAFADMEASIDKILGWLTGPLVMLSLIPQGNGYLSQGNLAAVNAMYAAKLAGRQNSVLVDATAPLQDTDGFMKMSYSIGDRVHPNATGYGILRAHMQAALASLGL